MQLRDVYLVDGARTPFIKAGSGPGPFATADLAVLAGRSLLARQPFAPDQLDQVIAGCVMPGPDEANIGRVVALRLGCGNRVPAWTVQRNCASGMQSIDSARKAIGYGEADLVLAGGMEAMSHAPVLWGPEMVTWLGKWSAARSAMARVKLLTQIRPAFLVPVIGLLRGLTDPIVGLSMGQTAEILARRFGITRAMMDEFAVASHLRSVAALEAGHLDELVTLYDGRGTVYDHDSGVRPDSAVDKLGRLKPVFDREFGNVTAGNSSQITDGASWVLLVSEEAVSKHGLQPMARVLDCHWAGLDPSQMGLGPVYAATPLLQRNQLTLDQIDYWEINEAFAAQVLACIAAWQDRTFCIEELGLPGALGTIDTDRLNVDGGAIAVGHPVGASGNRITLHLAKVLQRQRARLGIAAICIGGGQGGAMLLETV
ncbi:MAG: acetyl-CoA C-acetyltransferase [Gammaproteobacteria bacterium]|nr:acetyl-CoA C-acetyltransferase [Gammaproteobacteria bacterium]